MEQLAQFRLPIVENHLGAHLQNVRDKEGLPTMVEGVDGIVDIERKL